MRLDNGNIIYSHHTASYSLSFWPYFIVFRIWLKFG